MIEIKNIIFANSNFNFLKCFLCFINYVLPLRIKFANESYVALLDNNIQSLITLDKDSKSRTRFKITKLMTEENFGEITSELTNFVITKYRAQGATSFYIVIDEKQNELLNLFENNLNFRACGYELLYKINSFNSLNYAKFLKSYKKENADDVCKFYNENINSFNRFLFGRQNYQFSNNCMKYVFYKDNKYLGYFEVATKNKHDYYINFVLDFNYNIYIIDALKFIYSKLKQRNRKFNLFIKVKDYFMNSKELNLILKENNLELVSKSKILAKDYYKEIKEDNFFKNSKIIFNDPTIA